ncbi:MAG: DUF433 domain-containing protein [Gammaproteobacteria bacterium]|nr:DUF433 domain-containing protein [Gammaproteobacteria bacterium]
MANEILTYCDGRITINPAVCNGKPTLRNMRITAQTVLEYLSAGETEAEILRQYPGLEAADIRACLQFATRLMEQHYTLESVA